MLLLAGVLARTDQPTADPLFLLDPRTLVALLAIVVAAGLITTRRRHELVFLANLGVPLPVTIGLLATPALLAELILARLVA